MEIAGIVVSAVLAALAAYAAVRKLGHSPQVVSSYARVGVPEERLNLLATILLAGAAGLILGWFWRPIGIAAAAGLAVYFVLAVIAHIRHHDERNLPTPVLMLVLSLAALTLGITTTRV
jgi:hypothetical protein